jgi:hypothetical protein
MSVDGAGRLEGFVMRVDDVLSEIIMSGGALGPEHRPLVELARELESALAVAADHLPYHEPEHPDYEGSASDAGRIARLALDPKCNCSAA